MASPVLSVEKHTLTINTTSTSVSDMVFTADTQPNVQLTSAGSNLPAMVVGERFLVANHATHNGVYEVVTVTTSTSDYLVESITGATGTAGSELADCNQSISALVSLTGTPDTDNCIPFVSTRVSTPASSVPDRFSAYAVRADFTGGDTVRVTTWGDNLDSREIVCEVTVVEFNPSEVNVYQGSGQFDASATLVLNDPFGVGVNVVKAKSFLYFTYTSADSSDRWRNHSVRGVLTDEDTLTFDATMNQGVSPISTIVNWYVAEAINTAWAVDHVAIQIADAGATATQTPAISAVTMAKTFILGSYKCDAEEIGNTDSCVQNTIDVELTNSTTVTATRLDGTANNGTLDWAGCVVELAGNENVYRGQLTTTNASPDPAGHTTITSVNADNSMVHTCGMTGILGGSGNDNDNSDDVPAVFYAWTFFSDTQIDCEHYTGQTSFEAADVTWEVIEWDVGGTPRRVMVIS